MTTESFRVGAEQERLARQKARLQDLRDQTRQRYSLGTPGLRVATLISEMTDRLICEILEEALEQLDSDSCDSIRRNTAIIAVGGSGRGEMAPFSDADVLFLRRDVNLPWFSDWVSQVVRDCWDSGIKLGHSVRNLPDAIDMALAEPQFATALVEARLLWGDERLFGQFQWKFQRRVVARRRQAFVQACVAARDDERRQAGASVGQLEPDVKRSPGGLRDIHLIRWVGFALHGTTEFDALHSEGALTKADALALAAAQEFLMQIRVELHFAAGKAQEILTREEQLRLAILYGFEATEGQRPVERFMQAFFRHTTAVADVTARFVARHRPRSIAGRFLRFLFEHRSSHVFRVGPDEIDVIPRFRDEVCGDLERVLNLYELAGLYSVALRPELIEAVKDAVPRLAAEPSPHAAQMFLSILSLTGAVGRLLRGMYATGVLELVIPPMTHARCLLQFNQYHVYTVDEHSLRAVEAAERYDRESGPIAAAYRAIKHKEILHLALLLHDLGKGFPGDHCDVGRRLAEEVAVRLGLSPHLRELLMFLVHKHLVMVHLAFRRDFSDPEVLLRFSRDVGSPEHLQMLYVLTAADLQAVGPGTFTEWKADLLTDLYDRALLVLGGKHQQFGEAERLQQIRARVLACLEPGAAPAANPAALNDQLAAFPVHYLTTTTPEQIAGDLRAVELLSRQPVVVRHQFDTATNTVEFRVMTRDEVGSGCFSKICGALTARGMEILAAQICTTADGLVVDCFNVLDGDHAGALPDYRVQEVEAAIRDVLTGARTVESLF